MSYSETVRSWYTRSVRTVRPWYSRGVDVAKTWSVRGAKAARSWSARGVAAALAAYAWSADTVRRRMSSANETPVAYEPRPAMALAEPRSEQARAVAAPAHKPVRRTSNARRPRSKAAAK